MNTGTVNTELGALQLHKGCKRSAVGTDWYAFKKKKKTGYFPFKENNKPPNSKSQESQSTEKKKTENNSITNLRPYFQTFPGYAMTPKRESKRQWFMSNYI